MKKPRLTKAVRNALSEIATLAYGDIEADQDRWTAQEHDAFQRAFAWLGYHYQTTDDAAIDRAQEPKT
jgi:hypothetical protein